MKPRPSQRCLTAIFLAGLLFMQFADASIGDRLPEFKSCVETCKETNCVPNGPSIPFQRRLLLWDCPSECDYTCQHIITSARIANHDPIVQFHGKWPFFRFLGMQEPFSVLFSLLNFLAHDWGMRKLRETIPASYPLRKYYLLFGYFGLASWVFSMVFHTRDFNLTEKLDYLGAGASVLYGLYFAPIRVFRLDQSNTARTAYKSSILRLWTIVCLVLYAFHAGFLLLVRWDYTYNMAANVAVGIVQNILWSGFSIVRFRRMKRIWAAWPGLIVAWIILAMSFELLDFPGQIIDAHALWHAGTVVPTIWWYNFLIKDAQEDMHGVRLKA
ncbi:Per1-like protein [Rhizodiscina lignyota]|uniref:Post-GPI attachment to proteins factor 3 n=1 Tax=Rhizodiscina lignyota TaxID=1504668 RepID=A0A9P4M917_9PEZI|nr:Per1-like protein [Rhizodiscina lignyota]